MSNALDMKADQIRQSYIQFFTERGHRHVPSSPLVPPDDPTLLFTTAGMVQFKPLYSGAGGELPYTRACSVQKCMRAGGKGSDLENVGRTLRHHTFFEMLGNFSFGDYFKREALTWAWEFSTKVIKLDPDRIYASVFEDDQEAWDIWTREIGMPEGHMVRLGTKDNFWGPAGDTGACGPCSELYYDRGEQYGPGLTFQHATVNDEDPGSRFLEYWNCVFPQFDQQKDGSRPPLKNRGVDTGMGLERLTCIVQDKSSPYQTDLFSPIVERVGSLIGIDYSGSPLEVQQAMHVVADHVRALTFVLSEGILPGNEGRGYVMRRLLRRAARYARKVGQEQPFMDQVVDAVVETMGGAYPEIRQHVAQIKRVIRREEEGYAETLTAGLQRLESVIGSTQALSGADIFQLTATYGLPLDDICEIAQERGLGLDLQEYEVLKARHRETSRHGGQGTKFEGIYERLKELFVERGKTTFLGYPPNLDELAAEWSEMFEEDDEDEGEEMPDFSQAESNIVDLGLGRQDLYGQEDDEEEHDTVLGPDELEQLEDVLNSEYPLEQAEQLEVVALFRGEEEVSIVREGELVAVVLDETPFYAESGGQVGDTGHIHTASGTIRVTDTQKTGEDIYVHYGIVEHGEIGVGDLATGTIELERRLAVMRNHTATHLLQGALKRIVGQHVTQQGSYVGPDYLRFDFTNPEAVTAEQLAEIEREVNVQIMRDQAVLSTVLPLEDARKLPGIIAPFGEKYGTSVRVVEVPDWDVEFCGGTHMSATGGIGPFVILGESAVAAGVRRIEATTGTGALQTIQRERDLLKRLGQDLKVPREKVSERIAALQEELANARRQISQLRAKNSSGEAVGILERAQEIHGVKIVTHEVPGGSADELRQLFDALKSRRPEGLFAVLAGVEDGKVTLIAGATADVVSRGVAAGEVIKKIAPVVGGSGGGKKEMAQAGGRSPEKVGEALDEASRLLVLALENK